MEQVQLGANIRERRVKMALTQDQLAQAAGICDRHVMCKFEAGTRKPTVDQLARLAEALDCTILDLIAPGRPVRRKAARK